MTDNRITEGVGKKIVEALKMQANVSDYPNDLSNPTVTYPSEQSNNAALHSGFAGGADFNNVNIQTSSLNNMNTVSQNMHDTINIQIQPSVLAQPEEDALPMPLNISILKQLITKLPVGVTRQTGALIIRQTMEALGTSMKDVLKEAQQYQESLKSSSQACQNSIVEYKKQISILEQQSQQYQKQYVMLNDIISLFIQAN